MWVFIGWVIVGLNYLPFWNHQTILNPTHVFAVTHKHCQCRLEPQWKRMIKNCCHTAKIKYNGDLYFRCHIVTASHQLRARFLWSLACAILSLKKVWHDEGFDDELCLWILPNFCGVFGKIRFGRIMGYGQVGTAFQKCRNYLKRLKWKISRKASLSVVLPYGSTHREPKVLP